ncbi:uncharacterized protein LOC144743476 [Ciona intestinalis]
MLKTSHKKELNNVQEELKKKFDEGVDELVVWNGKLVAQAQKEHDEQLEALENEIRGLRGDKKAKGKQIAAQVKVLELQREMYTDEKNQKLEEQKQHYINKIEKMYEDFNKELKMKNFQHERSKILDYAKQLEKNEEMMQKVKQKYRDEAEEKQAKFEHKNMMLELKMLQLLLENKQQEDLEKDAMLLIEWENRCRFFEQIQKERNQEKVPHFWNLNEEPDLCKVIIHMVVPGESTIGSAETAKIQLGGHGIVGNHALVENDGKNVYIQPLADNIQILVNGKVVSGKQKLQDNDRIYFGPNHLYVFNKPQDGRKKPKQPMITFKAAWTEVTSNKGNHFGNKAGCILLSAL